MPKLWAAFSASIVMSLLVAAAPISEPRDPFSGRWRPDTQSLTLADSRLIITLGKSGFSRSTAENADKSPIPADGAPHPIKSDGYVDSTAVKIVSPSEVRESSRLKGRLVYESRYVLSGTGQTMTWYVTSFANATKTGVETSSTWRRISVAANGVHGLSGEWQQTGLSIEGDTNDWLLKLSGTSFSNRTPQGSGYEAQIGGPAVANEGDSAGATVSVVRPDPNTIVEYHALAGIVGSVLVLRASDDAASINAIAISPSAKKATSFLLRRVPQEQ